MNKKGMQANIDRRIISFLMDVIITYLLSFFTVFLFNLPKDLTTCMLLAWPYTLIYFIFSWLKLNGQTIGAKTVGIKIISNDGSSLCLKQTLLRASLLTVIVAPVGILIFIAIYNLIISIKTFNSSCINEKQRTMWDLASKTTVVYC